MTIRPSTSTVPAQLHGHGRHYLPSGPKMVAIIVTSAFFTAVVFLGFLPVVVTVAMVGAFSAPMLIDPGTERKAWQRARQLELQERRALERQEWQTYGF